MCEWGVLDPWNWAKPVGNSWRTTNDIGDSWDSFIRVLDNNIGLAYAAAPGGWNDPDMLEVGNGGMTFPEYQSHFALWCLLKAPLLIGCDLAKMSAETKSILMAPEAIAVNQDPLGVQGDLIYQLGPSQVWAGPLADGSRAVILFNRHTPYTDYNETIRVFFTDLGYPLGTVAKVRDLFARKDLGSFSNSFTASVPSHTVVFIKVTPASMDKEYVNWRPRRNSNVNIAIE